MLSEFNQFILICFFISIVLVIFNEYVAQKFNLFDSPDKLRKFHHKKTPITGGLIIFVSMCIFFILQITGLVENINYIQSTSRNLSLVIGCSIFFLIGLIDDKKNLSPNIKIILFILTIIILMFIDNEINIETISLSILDNNFSIGFFSYFWTIICFLLFINALNMFDGINLQVCIYSLISVLYLVFYHQFLNSFLIVVSFSLICFALLNYFSKSFLGNSGSYLLGFLIGYMFIKTYNIEKNIYADEIVLLMILPGLDLIRLFFIRIINKKHPFSPDRKHIHHYFLKKFNHVNTFFLISLMIWIPFFIGKFTGAIFTVLIFQFLLYTFVILRFRD